MELKTFDTILTELCDSFDALITPKTIARTNTNIIYLLFKAIAKGYEVINNVCVTLSNKFNPRYCSDDDLESVANIVGTEKHKGSASGLNIIITNNGESEVTLKAGTYFYALDEDTTFEFDITQTKTVSAGSSISIIAMSENRGSFPVTTQPSITVTSQQEISSDLAFSCKDNSALLGTVAETNLEFRKRINTATDRQNSLVELQETLKNLPYIFDCRIKFNDTNNDIVYDNITIPPFNALVMYAGEVKNELAEKIAEKIIFPTVKTQNAVAVSYENPIFASGYFTAYLTPFAKTQYSVDIIYKLNDVYINSYDAQSEIRTALFNNFVSEVHQDYVKEDDIYNVIEGLEISGIEILGVNLKYNGDTVNYIEVPLTRIPELVAVNFTQE